jgi:hypothetical protein
MLPSLIGIIASSGGVAGGDYESIATVTLGSAASTISFTSIPSTYQHLQVRGIARGTFALAEIPIRMRFNSDTGNNYARHILEGDGVTAAAYAASTGNLMSIGTATASTAGASMFQGVVADVLDYKDTNKYKTLRNLSGNDRNGSGAISFTSGLWMNTNAVTSITIFADSGNLDQYSSFALYGIKG